MGGEAARGAQQAGRDSELPSRRLPPARRGPRRAPSPLQPHPAAVAAVPHLPTAFPPRPGPHSPPGSSGPHLPQLLSLLDWLSRDPTVTGQSPPLATLTNERLAPAREAGSGAAGGKRVCLPRGPGYLARSLCARAGPSQGRVLSRGQRFVFGALSRDTFVGDLRPFGV